LIKSSKTTIKFANDSKIEQLHHFMDEYTRVVGCFVDILWELEKVPVLLPKEITKNIDTWLSARMIQCAGKQSSGIVRGTRVKQERRKYVVGKLIEEGKHKKARKLQRIIDQTINSKPNINNVCPELDSRFVKIDLDNNTSFDGWLTLSSIGNNIKISIPFKKSKHFNKMSSLGKIKAGIRLSRESIIFMFYIETPKKLETGATIGIDIGQKTLISCSNGFTSQKCIHGHDLETINKRMCKRKKGSKGFQRSEAHRENYINWTVNQLNLGGVKELKIENIKNMRKNRNVGRMLSHWTYTNIFEKLEANCLDQGVLVTRVSPTYTSKRCSNCGWTRSRNRKGKMFKCGQCGLITDADLNASKNIAANLKQISYKNRHLLDIKKGFWWKENGEEPIVPHVVKV
jgi:IS605 OrfB family transposase